MTDKRTAADKLLWDKVGPPLYYCSSCLLAIKVTVNEGQAPTIERPNGCTCDAQIYAPRRAIAVGEGGMNAKIRLITLWRQIMASITGRCV